MRTAIAARHTAAQARNAISVDVPTGSYEKSNALNAVVVRCHQ